MGERREIGVIIQYLTHQKKLIMHPKCNVHRWLQDWRPLNISLGSVDLGHLLHWLHDLTATFSRVVGAISFVLHSIDKIFTLFPSPGIIHLGERQPLDVLSLSQDFRIVRKLGMLIDDVLRNFVNGWIRECGNWLNLVWMRNTRHNTLQAYRI